MAFDWEAAAALKRSQIIAAIPEEWRLEKIPPATEQNDVTGEYIRQFLDQDEIKITEADAIAIAKKVGSGAWSAVEVAGAFCHRAALAHQLSNCLHEIFFDKAMKDATALDEYYATHGTTVGPLHGVPVSLKDQFHVKDVETTMGYTGWIGTFEGSKNDPRYKTLESEMVRELRAAGAVLYCKTSVPYTLMCGETFNNIIDYVWNPKNRQLAAGGSSGGEGALMALRGSPIGIGTDIGGSIRIPSAFNGLFGLRPSSGRLPYEGAANSMDGQITIPSVVGPMGTSLGALKLIVKSILSQSPWLFDPTVIPMPWRDEEEQAVIDSINGKSGEKLTFAVFKNNSLVSPQPPVARGLQMVVGALEKAGHEVIEWNPPEFEDGLNLSAEILHYDGGTDIHESFALSGEKIAGQISSQYGLEPGTEAIASNIAKTNVAHRRWKKANLDYWNSTASLTKTRRPIDAIISPVAPFAAARPARYLHYGYTSYVNGMDWTSVAIPVTTVRKEVDQADLAFKPMTELDATIQADYDAELYDGTPVGIQLIGSRLTEEKLLTIADYVWNLVE